MSVTADYLSEHPFAPTDIVNPPEAPTYRYRPDIETLVAFAGVETAALSEGSRVDLVIDDILLTYVLRSGIPTGSDLEVVPDDYDADFNAQYWLLVESGSNPGTISFDDITGVISVDQLPPGGVATVDSIGEDALYFFDEDTSTPFLISSLQTVEFISGVINFTDLGGVISVDQFPAGSVASIDSIDEDGFYFFDNDTFSPELIGKDDVLSFLLPDQTGNDGFVLQTNAGVLSWVEMTGGGAGAWGDLTGTLSDQTDLQSALDGKQPLDSDLTTIAGLTATTDNFIVSVSSSWSSRTPSQVRSTLALVIGTNVQAWDADLDTWAGKTPYAGSVVVTAAKVFTVSNTLTLTATDGSTLAIGTGGTLGTAAYTAASAYDVAGAAAAAQAASQPLDSDLTTIAGLTATTDNFIVSVASAWASRTPSQVRTTLGLVIGTNVQAWDADLDTIASLTATTDNFIVSVSSAWASRTPAQVLATLAAVGTTFQPLDTDLTTIAGLTATTDNFIVSVSSAWASRTPSQVRTTLGLVIGTNVQAWDADLDTLAGLTATTDNFIVSVSSAWASRTPSQVRTTLGLVIGTNVQAWDADLDTLAGLTATTDNFIVSVSSAWASRTPAQVLATLAAVGTTFQPLDTDLTTIAGLTATTDNFIVSVSSAWASRTPSQVRTTLALVIGTNVQAWDADLDSWAAITRASGFDTFSTTATSANLRSLLSDELGTGAALFDGPTLTLLLTTATCGASLASINIPAGTVPTTPNDGDIFADANCLYGCTDAGNPGVIPITHIIRADSTVTQANDANAHAIFTTPTNGRLTLETGTYYFEGMMSWSSMSATSGNIGVDILGAGTASTGGWLWRIWGQDAASGTIGGVSGIWANTSTGAAVGSVTAATAVVCNLAFSGTVEVTGAGTMIPTQTLANAAAAVLAIGSYIMFKRMGSTSMTSVGQWD